MGCKRRSFHPAESMVWQPTSGCCPKLSNRQDSRLRSWASGTSGTQIVNIGPACYSGTIHHAMGFMLEVVAFADQRRVGVVDSKRNPVTTLRCWADAVRLINTHDVKTPMFLYLAFTAPHSPDQAPQKYIDMYPGITDPGRRAYAAGAPDWASRFMPRLQRKNPQPNTKSH
jgi:Sulfatase